MIKEKTKLRKAPWVVLLLGIICISVSAILVKESNVNGITSAFYRVFIAMLFVLPLYIRTNDKNMCYKGICFSLLGGMFFAFELIFWNTAIIVSNATFPTLIVNLSSVWVSIGALIIFEEKLNCFHWIGNIISLFGVAVLIGVSNIVEMKVDKGFIFSFVASAFLALYILSVKQVRQKHSTLQVVFFTFLGCAVTLFICCIITKSKLYGFSSVSWIYLSCLGLITQVGGYFSINFSLGYIDSSKVSLITLMQPILTAVFAIIFLKETFSVHHIIGGFLVLFGLLTAIVLHNIPLRCCKSQEYSRH